MRKISEEKRNFRKNIITKIGFIVSLTGAIFSIYIGIIGLINGAFWEQYYFSLLIFFGVLALIGVIIGFFYEKVGIGLSLFVGFISIVNAPVLVSGFGILSFLVFLILIGGVIGLSANYENLKAWKEQNWKWERKKKGEHERKVGWEKKLILPGVIFLILGGILIFLSITYLLPWQLANEDDVNLTITIYPAIIFMIIGSVLIIYSVIKLRK